MELDNLTSGRAKLYDTRRKTWRVSYGSELCVLGVQGHVCHSFCYTVRASDKLRTESHL
jgi:hypothetical protein